jgi:predicted AlkP superfamily pyrophosphatase or phosphodiesterase
MVAERAFVMVWDGLRPDYVSADATPNLWRLALQGVWFERSHAVYATLTRANSPAIATGCWPGRAGVPGTSFCLPIRTGLVECSTGDAANLQRLSDDQSRLQPRYRRFGAFMPPFHPPTENPLLALDA